MFKPEVFIKEITRELSQRIRGKALIACSGGVDSSTAAVIVNRAIGERLTAVFVDTGYMRKNEPEIIKRQLKSLGLNLKFVDAKEEFYNALKGITKPEEKRRVIGERFIRVFERVAKEIGARYLVQGTIAPDWIESGGGLRDRIKSHHNVGALPEQLNLEIIEPLKDLYKDEIRKLARHLGIEASERQPFPGPGLAVRIIGEATKERTETIREACAIVEEEIERAVENGEMDRPWQYFAVLLPVKSVGVRGDVRTYGDTIVVRAVESIDGMTAAYSKIPHNVLERISIRITNNLKSISRVVYDITNKPPATIEWE